MLTVGLLHSVLHTLILALSASGRSVSGAEFAYHLSDTEFQFSVSIPDSWRFAPALYPAICVEVLPETLPQPTTHAYFKIAAAELRQNSCDGSPLASTQAYKSIWQIESVRNVDFLGAPAKDMLVRRKIGDNLTKIRKIFTVRKSNHATHVLVLSFSAPPKDYERSQAQFDASLASCVFLT